LNVVAATSSTSLTFSPNVSRVLTLGRRRDLQLDIAGYGAGRLSVVLVETPSGRPGAANAPSHQG